MGSNFDLNWVINVLLVNGMRCTVPERRILENKFIVFSGLLVSAMYPLPIGRVFESRFLLKRFSTND